MVIGSLEALSRQRILHAWEKGDRTPARKAQEKLLKDLIGQGEGVLDFQELNPRDPIKGLWDSLLKAILPVERRSDIPIPYENGKDGVVNHTEDGGSPYTVSLHIRPVQVREVNNHLKGATIDFVPFNFGGKELLRLFGTRVDPNSGKVVGESSFLYARTQEGVWERKLIADDQYDAWTVAPQTRNEFIKIAALKNLHKDKIHVTHFFLIPTPDKQSPAPTPRRDQERLAA